MRRGKPPPLRRVMTFLLLALVAAAPAVAQDAASQLERVVVTGSQVPRANGETALPVQIIRRQDIERSGALSTEELVGRISANFAGEVAAIGQNSQHPGYSGASLRGFGTHATLILLNGRRLANQAFSDESGIGVDLNAIPLSAIERIEVLRDGASAVYGSDAIAGVINFILRSDFRGIEASMEQALAQHGGGSHRHATVSLGAGDGGSDGYNLFGVLDYQQQHALHAVDRSFSSTSYRPDLGLDRLSFNSFPANVHVGRGFVNPAAPACTGLTVFVAGACKYDFVRQTDVLPPDQNLGLLVRGTVNLRGDSHAFVELVATRHKNVFATGPSPANSFSLPGNQPLVVPVGSPFYPAGLGLVGDIVNPAYRTVPLGQRIENVQSDQGRGLIGWQGTLAGWEVDTAAAQSVSRSTINYVSGFVDGQKLADAFATGQINPFGDSGPAGNASLQSTQIRGEARRARGVTHGLDLRAHRDLAQWAGGPVTLGVGVEARGESLDDLTTDVGMATLGGQYSATKSGSRRAQSAFAEMLLPLGRSVQAQLALRADRYSDFGTSATPKVALRWQPLTEIVFRASAGTGFRAPSLPELYTTQKKVDVPLAAPDPKRCAVTHLDSDCSPEAIVLTGGNPALAPERSRQASLGVVFEPATGALLSIDWWSLSLKNTIGELFDEIILSGDDRFEGGNVVRGPVDPAHPNLPGPIVQLNETNQNLGRRNASGLDIDLHLRSGRTRFGRFSSALSGSYLIRSSIAFDGVTAQRIEGRYGAPRWKHVVTLGWDEEPWQATLVQTLRSGTLDENPVADGSFPRVSRYRIWDAQVIYAGSAGWRLTAGVKNIFNSAPPFSNQSDYFQVGYDPSYADPRGRLWYGRISYRWL